MSDSRLYTILNALKGKIAADFTGASYSSGLDMRNRCIIGLIDQPPEVPYACVTFLDHTSEHGRSLGEYRMNPRFEIYLFVSGSSVEERTKQVLNLISDVIKNITANRFLGLGGGTIDDVLCQTTAIEGDRFGLENTAVGYIEVTTPFQSTTGV